MGAVKCRVWLRLNPMLGMDSTESECGIPCPSARKDGARENSMTTI